MKSNLLKIGKTALAVAVVAVLFALQSANAATIKLEVKVPGISSWVLVKVGDWPKYGGRVVWDPALGGYVTDDVARGETVRATVNLSPSEDMAFLGIWCESKQKYLDMSMITPIQNTPLTYVVPLNPLMDNIYVDVVSAVPATKRIPIGPRVR